MRPLLQESPQSVSERTPYAFFHSAVPSEIIVCYFYEIAFDDGGSNAREVFHTSGLLPNDRLRSLYLEHPSSVKFWSCCQILCSGDSKIKRA